MINILRDLKDSTISGLAKKFINSKIIDYGKIDNIKIDSQNKNIELEAFLKGEMESIIVTIEKYKVVQENDLNFVKFENVSSSREWIEVLINNFVIPKFSTNNIIKIDPSYAKIINLLI